MKTATASRATTAHHEAGHAIAAAHCGHRITCATIAPLRGVGAAGRVFLEAPTPRYGRRARADAHLDALTILYAGPAAQRLYDGSSWGCQFDDDEARTLLAQLPHDPTVARQWDEASLRRVAAVVVADDWPKLAAVADALLEHETLWGAEIAAVLRAVEAGRDWRAPLARARQRHTEAQRRQAERIFLERLTAERGAAERGIARAGAGWRLYVC